MKKLLIILAILALIFIEYRAIMLNIKPYVGDNGTVYLELGGNVAEYYAEPESEMKGE